MSKSGEPDLRYSLVLRYLEKRYPGIRKKAYREFCELVDPTLEKLSAEERERLRELSAEWLIFDREFEEGKTGLRLYCEENPDHRGRGFMKAMEESLATAFSGVFWIEVVGPEGGRVHLQDSATGKRLAVRDWTLSASIPPGNGGILMIRVVNVAGTWYFPGNPVGYLPIEVSEDMKRTTLEESDGAERSFVEVARMVFHRPLKPEDLPKFPKVPEPDVTDPQALAVFRDGVRQRYLAFAEKHGLGLSWEDLVDAVVHEDGTLMPHVRMKRILGEETKALGSMDDMAELSCIWSDLWNAFPHDSLAGLSPWEARDMGLNAR